MEDEKILDLFFARKEQGLDEMRAKYGKRCREIAYGILRSHPDAEECESDTLLAAWDAIPPQRPARLGAFLAKITRNLSLKRLRADSAQKRGGGEAMLSLDELAFCVGNDRSFDEQLQAQELADCIGRFLRTLPEAECRVFVCRYWYCDAVKEIAVRFGFTQSKVKMMLLRTREKLRDYLIKEGVLI